MHFQNQNHLNKADFGTLSDTSNRLIYTILIGFTGNPPNHCLPWPARASHFIEAAQFQVMGVKGVKSRLLTDLISLVGTSLSGIGYSIESAEVTAKDNECQLIDLLCVDFILLFVYFRQNFYHRNQDLSNILQVFPLYSISWK